MLQRSLLRTFKATEKARKRLERHISNVMSTPECLACLMICVFVALAAFIIAINIISFDIAPSKHAQGIPSSHGKTNWLEHAAVQRIEAMYLASNSTGLWKNGKG